MSRLKTRLARLEASGIGTTKLSPAARSMLTQTYGKLTAMFFPQRTHPQSWPAVARMRRDYIEGRAGIAARSEGAANWKAGHEARTELVTAGLAVAIRGGVEVQGLSLTPLGRATAFGLVADIIPGVVLSQAITGRLRGLPADREQEGLTWVSESTLFGFACTGDASRWIDLTDALLEPSIAGAVDSRCDIRGRCFYRFIQEFEPLPQIENIEPDAVLSEVFVDAFVAEVARLKTLEDADAGLIVPIRCT